MADMLDTASGLVQKNIAAADTAAANISRRDADIEKTLGSMPTFNATPPKLDVQPFSPPALQDPMKAWGSPTTLLAMVASLATRHPLTAALSSATAAINAVRSNNASAFQTAFDQWKANTDFAFKRAEWENKQYEEAIDLFKTNFDMGLSKIQTLATLNKDSAMLAAIQSGNISDIVGITNARTNALYAGLKGQEQMATVGEQINEWNAWVAENQNASTDDRVKAHQRIFPSTAGARMFQEYDINKASQVYAKTFRPNPMAGVTPGVPAFFTADGKPAPSFEQWFQNDWPRLSGQDQGGGGALPSAPGAKPTVDAAIANSPSPPPVERHDAGGGIKPSYPPSASNPDGTLPPKGALPVPAAHKSDPDGTTYTGSDGRKYRKQGNVMVPV